ncbi:MAG: 30S ribosomal protein S7 [Candidatus Heimdallarchaeota archaeon]|nr:MAG: 30S ribosomal protein S7 [Candidatus Heimdallarchaeota archaeon]
MSKSTKEKDAKKTKADSKKKKTTATKEDKAAKKTTKTTKATTAKAKKKEDPKKKADSKKKVTPTKEKKETKPTPTKETKAKKLTDPDKDAAPKTAPKKETAKVEKPKAVTPKPAPKATKPKTPSKEEKEEVKVIPIFDDIKLFNQWSYNDLTVVDPGIKAYISLRPVVTPHTGGRYAHQRFKKAEMPIVERLVNKLMRTKKGTGRKERMIKAVRVAFDIIYLQTGKNPIQVLIDAIQNAAPREEVTRITYGGMAQLQSVDVAPMRRVDIALTNIIEGVYKKSFNNILTAEEILARELIDAADNKTSSSAISKMLEIERIALSAR